MRLSSKLTKSHLERFQTFGKLPPKQACLLFGGTGLRAESLTEDDADFAETHLRIISGLYGVLRPYDDVKPVRDVPMGADFKIHHTETVLEYWGGQITKLIGKDAVIAGKKNGGKAYLLGACSEEYWKAIQVSQLPNGITPVFCD